MWTDKDDVLNSLSGNFSGDAGPVWRGRGLAAAALAGQMALLAGAFWLALAIRFDFSMRMAGGELWLTKYFLPLLPVVVGIKLLVWVVLGMHRGAGTWRHTSLGDALRVLCAGVLSFALIVAAYNGWQVIVVALGGISAMGGLPETLFIVDFLLSMMLVMGIRIASRFLYEESRPIAAGGMVRLLVIGAGEAAAAVLREIARMPEQRYRVVGLLDSTLR